MRILYHHRTLGDGAEGIHIHEMISAFRKLGHRVDTFSLARPESEGRGDTGPVAVVRRFLPPSLGEIARLAANVPEYLVLRSMLKRARPDTIYVRHALFDVAACLAGAWTRVPVVLEVNTLYSHPDARRFEPLRCVRLAAALERLALRSASLVVAVSTPLKDHINGFAKFDAPVLVLPNGANPNVFDPLVVDGREVRERYGLADRFIVGWTGVMRRWHGIEVLLEAVRRLPEAVLLLVGDGVERPALETLADRLGVTERVYITGRVSHGDVPKYVAAFDAAVAAADATGVASPMKVVEYMALARAVVVPRLPNLSDLVEDRKTGLQFTPGDPADLVNQLRQLSTSAELRQRLGISARQAVLDRLNWVSNARAVLTALEANQAWGRPA